MQLNQFAVSIDAYSMPKISTIAQFSLEILKIQYWKLLLACPDVPGHTHMNELNLIDVFMYA